MPKSHSGIRRGNKSGNAGGTAAKAAKTQEQEFKKAGGDWVVVNVRKGMTINASDPDAIEQLRKMAKRNEVPEFVRGSRDDLGRWYEEFDRLYDLPSGDLGQYKVHLREGTRRDLVIDFENNFLFGKPAYPHLAHDYAKASPAEISGATKFAVYSARGALESGLFFRAGGWPEYSFKNKYGEMGERVFSNVEKERISEEMRSFVTRRIRSPLSKVGEDAVNYAWIREKDGWKRRDM